MYFHVINTLINQNVLLFKNYSTIKHLLLCQSYCPQHQWSVPFFCSVFCRVYFWAIAVYFLPALSAPSGSVLWSKLLFCIHTLADLSFRKLKFEAIWETLTLSLFLLQTFVCFCIVLLIFSVLVAHKRRFLPLYLIEQQEWTGKDMEQTQTLSAAWSPAQP